MPASKLSILGRARTFIAKSVAIVGVAGAVFATAGAASAHTNLPHASGPAFNPAHVLQVYHTPGLNRCKAYIQGHIPWNYTGSRIWHPANLSRLCGGIANGPRHRQPGICFRKVMFGGVDWATGPAVRTKWNWKNAVKLCAGTRRASGRIRCFKHHIASGRTWPVAIRICKHRP